MNLSRRDFLKLSSVFPGVALWGNRSIKGTVETPQGVELATFVPVPSVSVLFTTDKKLVLDNVLSLNVLHDRACDYRLLGGYLRTRMLSQEVTVNVGFISRGAVDEIDSMFDDGAVNTIEFNVPTANSAKIERVIGKFCIHNMTQYPLSDGAGGVLVYDVDFLSCGHVVFEVVKSET